MKGKKVKAKNRWPKIYGAKEDRILILENFAVLLTAGIDVIKALDSLTQETRNKQLEQRLQYISQAVEGGSSLWLPIQQTQLFPKYAVNLIKVGEESGTLAKNLRVLAEATKRDQSLRQNIISAMAYPVFVLGITLAVGFGIAWFLLPRLVSVFSQLGSELPWITVQLLAIGTFVQSNGVWFIPLVLFLIVLVGYLLFFNSKTKFIGQSLLLSLPGFKNLVIQSEISRFGLLASSLMDAGVPLTSTFQSLASVSTNTHYQRLYHIVYEQLLYGKSLDDSLKVASPRSKLIPPSVRSLISAGEQSGSLQNSFSYIGEAYDSKARHATKLLTTLMEPVLLVIVWLGVLTLAIAIILPIYDVVGQFNNKPEDLKVEPELPQNQVIQVETALDSEADLPEILTDETLNQISDSAVEVVSTSDNQI